MSVSIPIRAVAVPRWLSIADVERVSLALAAAAAVVMRVAAVFRYRIDSDEPQHLHVVWGWTHGLLPYRDFFDNHMPLFHVLCAPLLRIIGERPDALIAMRLAMLPLYAITIALTYRIAASCYGRRVAMWGAVVAALVPGYLLWSTEFRTDDLWTVFWLASVAILVSAPPRIMRVAASGFVLGLAASVSAKTTLLLLSLAIGAVAAGQARGKAVVAFLLAFAIPPAAIVLYFAHQGAFEAFVYGAFSHNILSRVHVWRLVLFPFLLTAIALVGLRVTDSPRRMFLFITAHFYAAAMYCLWPLVEHEHWLPYFPLAAITIVPLLRIRQVMGLVLVEVILTLGIGQLWRDQTRADLAVVQQTLDLTRPGEPVMDLKGETVFRNRAFFYVLEPLTKHRIRAGRIRDTIVADMLRTKTMLVVQDHYGFPRETRRFLRRNFVSVGAVRVAGKIVHGPTFEIEVPGEYAVVGDGDAFTGFLDGAPYAGPRNLVAGIHTMAPSDRYAVLWARAAERGLTPFGVPQHKLLHRPHVRRGNREVSCAKHQ